MTMITDTEKRKIAVGLSPASGYFSQVAGEAEDYELKLMDTNIIDLTFQETLGVARDLVNMLFAFAEPNKATPESIIQACLGDKARLVCTLRSALGPEWKTRVVRALNDYTIDELAAIAINDSLASYDFVRTQTREDLIGRVLGGIERQDTVFRRNDHFVVLASGGQLMVSE